MGNRLHGKFFTCDIHYMDHPLQGNPLHGLFISLSNVISFVQFKELCNYQIQLIAHVTDFDQLGTFV